MSSWWQTGIVYQIYPRSFQDSNGDGVGDLPGIEQRLGYLRDLGVDALWISPIYPSPMADFGYDVSDYRNIHPLFGTMADMDRLIDAAHSHNLKLILDFVPNHTSNQHPWFLESRSSRDNPRRDWYIWRDPAPDGRPPTSWLSRFDGESAWEWDAQTGQYYLHSFLAEQPDLNWRNPAVRAAMLDVLRFWFDKGVDGFRVDVSYRVFKDVQFRDNPPNPHWREGMDPSKRLIETYTKNRPDIYEFNGWLRQVADEYPERVLIGEINLPPHELVLHYGRSQNGFHLPFNFNLIFTEWQAAAIRDLIETYEAALPDWAWPNWVLGNHDQHRVASRVGSAQARLAMLLLTLRGTPTLYYGDELGLLDGDIAPEQVQDPWEKKVPGLGLGRDPERTPMPWTAVPHAGFCPPDVIPWLPLNADSALVNVASQSQNPDSMLVFTQKLIQLRRETAALHRGSYRSLPAPDGVLAYERRHGHQARWVVLNLTGEAKMWRLPEGSGATAVLLTTAPTPPTLTGDVLPLRPNEGVILAV